MLHPNSTIRIFGADVPIAVWLWLVLWGIAEVVAMRRFRGLGIDHVGHFGGLAAGFGAAVGLRWKAERRGKADEEMRRVEMGGENVVGEEVVSV